MQKSMGGAVTAAPMDTMTAISNPAGMARVGNRADFSMEAFMPKRSVDFSAWGGAREEGGSELYGVPSVGWVANAFGRDDVVFGGGMFATSGLGVDYGEVLLMPGAALDGMSPGSAPHEDVTFDGHSAIEFWKMAPTVAWNVDERLSVGAALNVDYQSLTIRQKFGNMPFGTGPLSQMDVNFDLGRPTSQLGYGASVGTLYDLTGMVTLGASYTTKQRFGDAQFRVGSGDVAVYNGAMGLPGKYKMDMDYPQQAAVGIAVQPNDRLLVDLDVKWIDWSATHGSVTLTGPANSFDTNGDAVGDSNTTQLPFGWKDQTVYALGVQWTATDTLTLRAGYNYAKAPIDQADVMNNLVFPALVERHVTVGFDQQLGDHWGVGATFMKAYNKRFTGSGDVPVGFQTPNTPFTADSNFRISLAETSVGLLLYYLM
ncbi:MAG: TonB-dependent receptor [Nitrospirae bacterium]|nr:TonB-dependent receptor [Nitrospirota bacterium]